MLAFNRRFDIKRVAGLQVPMAIGLVGVLISCVFALMLPWPLKALVLCLLVFSIGTVIYVAYYGNDIAFARVIVQTKRCRGLTTSEHITRV
jgi:hypothetical protein